MSGFAAIRSFAARVFSFRRQPDGGTDFRILAENSSDVIMRIGSDGLPSYVSPSSLGLFGWRPEEIVGRPPADFVMADDLPIIMQVLADQAAGRFERRRIELRARHKDGAIIWVESAGSLVRNPETGGMDAVVVMRDVTERKMKEQRLDELARTDGLTELGNRRAFDQALDATWRQAIAAGLPLSLLLIDLDRFKAFNDAYGHQVGDDCLRAVARALRECVPQQGFVGRYGGEEMVALLFGSDPAAAGTLAETLRQAVANLHIPHSGNPEGGFATTVSIGVATAFPVMGGSPQMPAALLHAADRALYKAKHGGRNRHETNLLLLAQSARTEAA